jgi:hypothetical protein
MIWGCSSAGERLTHIQEATGSKPVIPTSEIKASVIRKPFVFGDFTLTLPLPEKGLRKRFPPRDMVSFSKTTRTILANLDIFAGHFLASPSL